jgi:hypothetical protein
MRANSWLPRLPKPIEDETNFLRSERVVDFDRSVASDTGGDSSLRFGDRRPLAILLSLRESRPYELAGIQAGKGRRNRSNDIASATEVLDVETVGLNSNHLLIERNLLGYGELEL